MGVAFCDSLILNSYQAPLLGAPVAVVPFVPRRHGYNSVLVGPLG